MTTPGNRPLRKGDHPTWTKTGKNSRRKWIPSDSRLYGGQMTKSRNLFPSNSQEDNKNVMDWDKIDWLH